MTQRGGAVFIKVAEKMAAGPEPGDWRFQNTTFVATKVYVVPSEIA